MKACKYSFFLSNLSGLKGKWKEEDVSVAIYLYKGCMHGFRRNDDICLSGLGWFGFGLVYRSHLITLYIF